MSVPYDPQSDDDLQPHRDIPFTPEFMTVDVVDLGMPLGLAPAHELDRMARNAVILALYSVPNPARWHHYPRSKAAFPAWRTYFGAAFGYTRILRAIDQLAEAGIIEHQIMKPHSCGEFRSRFRPTAAALEMFLRGPQVASDQIPFEVVRLKDKAKRLTRYSDNDLVRELRRDIEEHNEMLAAIDIRLLHSAAILLPSGLYSIGDGLIANPMRQRMYRVFNVDWHRGGRWYGGWWQILPSALRADLLIGGRPVIEIDYPCFHPTLLAASAGIPLVGDPYEIDGYPRDHGKLAFQAALNAPSRWAAIKGLANEFRKRGERGMCYASCTRLYEEIVRRNAAFEPFFGSDAGARLQRIDGDMSSGIQSRLRGRGIPGLGVHDSFIVFKDAEGILQDLMDEVLETASRKLRASGL